MVHQRDDRDKKTGEQFSVNDYMSISGKALSDFCQICALFTRIRLQLLCQR